MLDLSSLEDASTQLGIALKFSVSDLAVANKPIFEQFRNSVIQCFEYTYELCVKSLRRFLELTVDTPSVVDDWEFKDLMREAAIRGLISNPTDWFEFRRLRNLSSHAYNAKKAQEVYIRAEDFLQLAATLLTTLKSKQSDAQK